MFDSPHLTGPTEAGLNLVDDQLYVVLVCELLQLLEVVEGWVDEASLALNRLGDYCAHRARLDLGFEDALLYVVDAGEATAGVLEVKSTAVAVGVGREVDSRHEGTEAHLIRVPLPCEAHRHPRPAVETVLEADDVRPLGRLPDQLDGVLYCLGTAVDHHRPLRELARRDLDEGLRQLDVGLVVDYMDAAMDQLAGLL